MLIRACPRDQHVGKGGEGSRSGHRVKLSCDAGPAAASADPQVALELEASFRVVFRMVGISLPELICYWIWTTSKGHQGNCLLVQVALWS